MVDLPGRSAFGPDDRADRSDDAGAAGEEHSGWGSPVPAEYGSLHALSPPEQNREPGPLTTGLFSAWSRGAPRKPSGGEGDTRENPASPPGAPWPAGEGSAPIGSPPRSEVGDHAGVGRPVAEEAPAFAAPDPLIGAEATPPAPALPPRAAPTGRPGRRPGRSRSRVVLRHVDVATVAKMSLLYYLIILVVIVVAAVLLWVAADSFGTLPSIDKSVRTLFSLRKFQLHAGAVAVYTAAAGVALAVVGTLANILLALVYNLMADVVGGVRVELESFGRE